MGIPSLMKSNPTAITTGKFFLNRGGLSKLLNYIWSYFSIKELPNLDLYQP